MKVEICSATFESAIAAYQGGANRIELCSELSTGGVSPSAGMIQEVRKNIPLEINVLLRPRSGDFILSSQEAEVVLRDIAFCAQSKVQGIVVGALTAEGKINKEMSKEWLKEAHRRGLSATYHRAIDRSANIYDALEDILSLGYDRILTSGGCSTAYEGIGTIMKMVEISKNNIIIMPGSGVNKTNIREIIQSTKVSEIHFSASASRPSPIKVFGGIATTETLTNSDAQIIRSTISAI